MCTAMLGGNLSGIEPCICPVLIVDGDLPDVPVIVIIGIGVINRMYPAI